MQVEMRKREQELLAKIKEQQKELDAVKAEKTKVEKELTKQERERENDRRLYYEKEREIERQRMESERLERQKSVEHEPYRKPQYERVLTREKASPAHLRGRRPPSLVSSENDEEVKQISLISQQRNMLFSPESASSSTHAPVKIIPIDIIRSDERQSPTQTESCSALPPTLARSVRDSPPRPNKTKDNDLHRKPSFSRSRLDDLSTPKSAPTADSLKRSQSFRIKRDNIHVPKVPQSPTLHRRSNEGKRDGRNAHIQRTPSFRRKLESSSSSAGAQEPRNSSTSRTAPTAAVNVFTSPVLALQKLDLTQQYLCKLLIILNLLIFLGGIPASITLN